MKITILKLIIILLLFTNCNRKKPNGNIETSEEYGDLVTNYSYKTYAKNKSECDRLLISNYDDERNDKKVQSKYSPFAINNNFEILGTEKFDLLLKNSKKTGYCCCPNKNLSINFFNKTKEFDNYLVDTIEYKDKVIIFDESYQFSHIVKKIDWRNFLKESEHLNSKEYLTSELNSARKVFNFVLKNNLILKTSNNVSKYWMYYDGEFYLKVKEYGNELKAIDVIDYIKNEYPKDKYKVEILYQKHSYSPDKSDYYDCEIEMKIYCNIDFYNNFNLYKSKSSFKKTKAEFCVLGKIETLNKLNFILKETE
jgi:hypothetical protein